MRDPQTENWLESESVPYHYEPSVSLDEVQRDDGTLQQTRLETDLFDDLLDRLRQGWKDGSEFPPVVVGSSDEGYMLLDGHHRTTVLEEFDVDEYPAYVVESEDERIHEQVARQANTFNGEPPSKEERYEHAIRLHEHQGMTLKDAAQLMKVHPSTLRQRYKAKRVTRELQEFGVSDRKLSQLPREALLEIHTVSRTNLWPQVARLISEAGLKGQERKNFIQQVRNAESDNEAEETVDSWRHDLQDRVELEKGGRSPSKPLRRLEPSLDQLADAIDDRTNMDLIPKDERCRLADRCCNMATDLRELAEELCNDTN